MKLKEENKSILLGLARQAIENNMNKGAPLLLSPPPGLEVRCGVFVSLYVRGKLRGCIGTFSESQMLFTAVIDMAIASATCDSRFLPLKKKELEEVEIEISVLTPRRPVSGPSEIIIGVHGIYMKSGSRKGTLLPQVAVNQKWDASEFLSQCAEHKAGIGRDGWKDAELFTYEALVFSSSNTGDGC